MKRWKDPFPQTPKGFHDRVEQTLRGLEDRDMKQSKRYRKLTLALVAALIALLAIGAVAAVIGNNQLKDELSDAGAKDMAERVQDVHLADAGEGFNFTIDEAVWEGDDLYVSYTLSVPEDGNTYLVGLLVPRINGKPAEYRVGGYLEDGWTCSTIALGGKYPATDTFVKPIIADSRELELKDMKLEVGAAFFKSNRPLQYLPGFYNEEGDYAHPEMLVPWKSARFKTTAFPDSDTLYYWDMDECGAPMVDLWMFPDVLEVLSAEDAEEKGYAIDMKDYAFSDRAITPKGLDHTGIASLAAERSVSLPLNKDMVSHDLYNGLEKNTFRYDGMTITIEKFRMTHFKIETRIWLLPDEGMPASDEDVDFSRFPELLFYVNGRELYSALWGGTESMRNDTRAFCWDYTYDGYVPLGDIQSLQLVAKHWDEAKREFTDEVVIADLTPILDTAAAEEEAQALATREAAGSWQPGDPEITVWATKGGTYYHLEEHCSGMYSAVHWDISKAVEDGKKPCPVCAGGKPGPAEWEEGEDISCFQDG